MNNTKSLKEELAKIISESINAETLEAAFVCRSTCFIYAWIFLDESGGRAIQNRNRSLLVVVQTEAHNCAPCDELTWIFCRIREGSLPASKNSISVPFPE
jgi:hypothetical protein